MPIPKKIHYCWYGKKPLPKLLRYCIASWEKMVPEYEIICWNEANTDFDCEFVKKAYAEEKWAFVSDYVRLQVVYEHGGIYLDTDMLLLKSLNDFLDNECFFVAEHNESIGVGIFGAQKSNAFVYSCLQKYREGISFIPIPKVVSDTFTEEYGVERRFDKTINMKNIIIYEPTYFYALPYDKLFDIHIYKKYMTPNSYGMHLWYGSWHTYNELVLLRRKEYYKALKRMVTSVFKEKKFSYKYLRKVLVAFRDSLITPNAFK